DGALATVQSLLDDMATEATPIVVLGRWVRPDEAAPFVALGVARAMAKPIAPAVLRRACVEAISAYRRREAVVARLGELAVDELGVRLTEELRRGLCDAAGARARAVRVELGDGRDILAALWGAVARIRDVVSTRSSGSVRFAPTGP